jgi:anaerobic magnesium-protoporphyrin IX monomethyl ester cyclase
MKITTLNPPFLPEFSRGQRSPAVTRSGTLYFPVWLAYATGALEQNGFEVDLVDAPADGLDMAMIIERIDRHDPRLIVIETSTPSIISDVEIADVLASSGRFTVLVGTHPSALPRETLEMGDKFHAVVSGEYELPLLELAARLNSKTDPGGIPGLSIRIDGGIASTPAMGYLEDLDSLPFVSSVYARHLNIPRYNNPNALHPQVMIMGGRGCPQSCSFCVFPQTMQGRRYRCRSVENVVAEMKWVEQNLPEVRAVFFEDDTISTDMDRLRELAASITAAGVGISWTANMRADVDYDTLKACTTAGLRSVCVGFESGSDSILEAMKKGLTTQRMREFVRDARRAGLLVHGCFIYGIQGETMTTMRETLDFALELDLDTAQFYPLMVYPGTEAYEEARSTGNLTCSSWRDWLTNEGLHNCVVRTEELSGRDLVDFCDYSRRRFYLRPGYVLRKAVRSISDADERRRILKAFGTLRKYLFRRSPKGRRD